MLTGFSGATERCRYRRRSIGHCAKYSYRMRVGLRRAPEGGVPLVCGGAALADLLPPRLVRSYLLRPAEGIHRLLGVPLLLVEHRQLLPRLTETGVNPHRFFKG